MKTIKKVRDYYADYEITDNERIYFRRQLFDELACHVKDNERVLIRCTQVEEASSPPFKQLIQQIDIVESEAIGYVVQGVIKSKMMRCDPAHHDVLAELIGEFGRVFEVKI